jgi:hypothetical protein
MAHPLTTCLSTATTYDPGTVATAHVPLLAAITPCVALVLIGLLALVSTLAKSKARRDAAYKVLKLLLDAPRRSQPAEPPTRRAICRHHPTRTN